MMYGSLHSHLNRPEERNSIADILSYWNDPLQSSIPFQFQTSIDPLNGFSFQNLNHQQGMRAIVHNPFISDQVYSPLKFHNSDSSLNFGYPASINNFNPTQHFGGGSSMNNVASTSIFNNGISAATEAFDGSLLDVFAPPPAQNFCQQTPFNQISCNTRFPTSANEASGGPSINNVTSTNIFNDGLSATKVFHNHYNTQARTYLRPQIQMPAPQQPDQWASQPQVRDYSNGFKIRQLNPSCAPGDLPSSEPWPTSIGGPNYMSGNLMDIFNQGSVLPVDQLLLEEGSNISEDFMGNGPMGREESSQPSPDYMSGTLMDVYNSFIKFSDSTKDALQNSEDTLGPRCVQPKSRCEGIVMSDLNPASEYYEPLEFLNCDFTKDVMHDSEDTLGPKVNKVHPESRCEGIVIPDASEYYEPLGFLNSDSTKGVMQNSEDTLGPKVNKVQPESKCEGKVVFELFSTSEYYEPGLESMQSVKPSVFESEKMSTPITSPVHNGLEPENFKKLVNSFEDKESESGIKNTKRSASMADFCDDNVLVIKKQRALLAESSDLFSASEYYEPLEFLKSDSIKDVMQNIEDTLGPKVNKVQPESKCEEKVVSDLFSASEYYEPGLESMQSVKPSVCESEKMNTPITSPVHNGLEPENFKKLVNSFEDKVSGSGIKNTKRSASMADFCDDNALVIKKQMALLAESSEANELRSEPMNIKKHSASLVDYLRTSQIEQHLSCFITSNKDLYGTTPPSDVSQSTCQLCVKSKLLLAPTPVFCSSCDMRIKQNAKYYQSLDKNTNTPLHTVCICMRCYKGSGGSTVSTRDGESVSKLSLQMENNDEEIEDSWVLRDKCKNWQHRICGLYNNEIDLEGESEYICPKCYLKEIENGTRIVLPKSSLRAKDLPRTNLSDHIEKRLLTGMMQERNKTAKSLGIKLEEVSAAKGFVIRVVVSLDKELEVKKQFRDIFDRKDYPEKMKYRSKLILLFQNIGGVDTCLFGMYVQEFGSDCNGPNNRCVYISYIDSVKYFQPERRTASGESLRTFVYHEILLGYLEHCKKRGFASCHIWSCPLIKGEDYIFYCHPKDQKTPEKKKLRQWYKIMIKKGVDDGIVVGHTNLYEEFFGPSNSEITAARLPYFEGDCWSDVAVNISKRLGEQESSGGRLSVKSRAKRSLMSGSQESSTKDASVMRELGDTLLPDKENLMIVRLHHTCTSCNEVMISGSRWFCKQCNKIQLCSSCFYRGKTGRCYSCKNSALSEDLQSYVPVSIWNEDAVLVNNFFETREDFMGKCQNSLYQFDTLHNAKYSSMMILYHLKHNLVIQPKADTCHTPNQIPPSAEVPSESKRGQSHKLKPELLARLVNALNHVTRCEREYGCNPDCQTAKSLLQHAYECRTGKSNGCGKCLKARQILTNHIGVCRKPNCDVPCCMDKRRERTLKPARRVGFVQCNQRPRSRVN